MITTSAELEELIDSTVSIPTIPTTLLEINRIFSSSEGSAKECGDVIERDPAIAAKVLRLVNSPLYGLRNPVAAIPLACSILGLKTIKNLVVQASVLETFGGTAEVDSFNTRWLWDHSFKTGMAAKLLVQASPGQFGIEKDEAYTCGLVHDVGKMVLLHSQEERFAEALRFSVDAGIPLAKAEAELFGFSHAHVGGLLAQRWNLSHGLQVAVMYHHSPGGNPDEWTKGFLVHAANTIAHQSAVGTGGWRGDLADEDTMKLLGIPDEVLATILEQVRNTSIE